eukprot:scaffold67628_cov73-Phaeocystis_antarctica.AAC.3
MQGSSARATQCIALSAPPVLARLVLDLQVSTRRALHGGGDLVERVAHVAHPLHGLPEHLLGRHHRLLVVCERADRALQRRAH